MNIIDCDLYETSRLSLEDDVSAKDSDSQVFLDKYVALGNFDGMHRGHQALFQEALQYGENGAVLLFKNHTMQALDPMHTKARKDRLTSLKDQLEYLRQLGVQTVFLKTFDLSFAHTQKDVFIQQFLFKKLGARGVIVGDDYRFGAGAEGDVHTLREYAASGLETLVIPPVCYEGERISSTRVRYALKAGQLEDVNAMLGRFYRLEGLVVHGAKRGRHLGYPTANLETSFPYVIPKEGVYLVRVWQQGELLRYGMTNIGSNPTFEKDGPVKIETHLFDFHGDLYGKTIQLEFLYYARGDILFSNKEELIEQMQNDERNLREKMQLYFANSLHS